MAPQKTAYRNDRDLVSAILDGDRDAFAVLIKQTEGLVASMIFQLTGSHAEVKDLAQDIYVQVYRGLPAFRFGAKVSTWVGQIAYHACLRWLTKRKLVYLEELPDSAAADDDVAFGDEMKFRLGAAIQTLPPVYRMLVTLFHTEEQSYQEIAEITGLPEGTIKSYLFRARKQLREYLIKHDKDKL